VSLHRRSFANRFAIGRAGGWRLGEQGGAITITASGAVAEIDVYSSRGSGRRAR